MVIISVLSVVSALGSAPATANAVESAPATYIMQVSSNLGCSSLNIELISTSNNPSGNIEFTTGAYAATKLNPGAYRFGDVTCNNKEGVQTFDVLKDKFSPISLKGGQSYYAGRLIFEEKVKDDGGSSEVFDNCTRVMSGARGEGSNECRDGTGPSAAISKQVSVYVPKVDDEDINALRTALSATKEQLLYLPLKV
ncbi:hypothetical protein OAP14_06430 [Aliiglaciecola sp.]|nr:hypothetical protein [Aliiglaciecola sp.]